MVSRFATSRDHHGIPAALLLLQRALYFIDVLSVTDDRDPVVQFDDIFRARDPHALDYGRYWLLDDRNIVVYGHRHRATLDRIAEYLNEPI